jgi:hypothetical protein
MVSQNMPMLFYGGVLREMVEPDAMRVIVEPETWTARRIQHESIT